MEVTLGGHRPNLSHQFVLPTPHEGQIIVPQFHPYFGGMFAADFQIRAYIFGPNIRYRQYVCGWYKYNGQPQVHQLHGGNLHATNFIEDGNANGVYGVLGQNINGLSTYEQGLAFDRFPCTIFNGYDTPSDALQCALGTMVEINLSFRGVICDANAPNTIHTTRNWFVRGTCIKGEHV